MSFCDICEDICTFLTNCPFSFCLSFAISIVLGMNTKLFLMVTLQLFKTTTFFPNWVLKSFFLRFRGTGSTTFCCTVCWTEPITTSDCAVDATCLQRKDKVNNNNNDNDDDNKKPLWLVNDFPPPLATKKPPAYAHAQKPECLLSKAQLFEGRLAPTQGWILRRVSFLLFKSVLPGYLLCSFWSVQSSNCRQKELNWICLLKLLYLYPCFALTLGYLG